MVSIFGKNGSAKKGEIVKEYEPGADYLGTFFTVRFGQSSSVSLFSSRRMAEKPCFGTQHGKKSWPTTFLR